jgi:ankyrin repeat protein
MIDDLLLTNNKLIKFIPKRFAVRTFIYFSAVFISSNLIFKEEKYSTYKAKRNNMGILRELFAMISADNLAAIEKFPELCPNVTIKNENDTTAIEYATKVAIETNSHKIFQFLVNALINGEVDLNMQIGCRKKTLLHLAVECSDVETVKKLLEKNVTIAAKDNFGETPIDYAAKEKKWLIFSCLIANEASINIRGNRKVTPLHYAVLKGDLAMVNELLTKGANPNTKDHIFQKTPIDYAIDNKQWPIFMILIEQAQAKEIFISKQHLSLWHKMPESEIKPPKNTTTKSPNFFNPSETLLPDNNVSTYSQNKTKRPQSSDVDEEAVAEVNADLIKETAIPENENLPFCDPVVISSGYGGSFNK